MTPKSSKDIILVTEAYENFLSFLAADPMGAAKGIESIFQTHLTGSSITGKFFVSGS